MGDRTFEGTPAQWTSSHSQLDRHVHHLLTLSGETARWLARSPSGIADDLRRLLAEMLETDLVDVELQGVGRQTDAASTSRPAADVPSGRGLHVATLALGADGALGRLAIAAPRPDFPTPLELELLQAASNAAVIGVRHAELSVRHARAQHLSAVQAAQQAVVARLGQHLLSLYTADESFAAALGALRDTLRVDYCDVFELDREDGTFVLRAGDGWPEGQVGRHRISAGADCEAGYVLRFSEPLVVTDHRREHRFHEASLPRELDVQSGVTVPVPGARGVVGVLGVHSRVERAFTPADVGFQQSVAVLLASALERQRSDAQCGELLARVGTHEAAERAGRLGTTFLGLMSHELRTPLNAIGGYVQLLQEGIRGPLTDEQHADLARVARNQRYLLSLIENVLSFLESDNGRIRYDVEEVSVDELLTAVDDAIRPLADAKRLRYEHHVPSSGLRVRADREKLQQILINLLSNATKFTAQGGMVALDCTEGPATFRLHVRDSGVGIPAERLDSLFEPFAQLRTGGVDRSPGTGLGLSISRELTLGMGGNLVACSEPEKGSVFTVVLPR